MFAKKTLCMLSAGTMLAAAAPAFADRGDDYRWRGRAGVERPVVGERQVVQERRRVVVREQPVHYRGHRQPVYSEPAYYPAPVYAPEPVYSEPAYYPASPVYSEPAYYPEPVYRQDNTAIGAIGGAILGAIIGNQLGHGNGRGAVLGAGAGAIIGGMIGRDF